jgi:threonine/homoserine/homoserine lactone efflux protein
VIPAETLILFASASVALCIAPGPDNLFVLTQSGLYGRLAGFMVTLGLCTGLLVHTTAVAVGVAVIFQTSELAFNALKLIGAGYLLYLAWLAFRADDDGTADRPGLRISLKRLYARGVVMNLTNPKVAIFFLAFLPQFANPELGPIGAQILVLGIVFILATIVVFGAIAWGAGFIGGWLREAPGARKVMDRLAGLVFVALALRLVITER